MADAGILKGLAQEGKRLERFIRHRISDSALVEDIYQDVLVEYVEAERKLEPIGQVGAWLFRVARNKITDWFRRKRPSSLEAMGRTVGGESGEEPDSVSLADARLTPAASAADEAEGLDDLRALERALSELPEAQRVVFIAHELDGLSFKALAERTGENVNTLLSRKHAAVKHLRKRLGEAFLEDMD